MIGLFVLAVDFMNFTYTANPCSGNVPVPVVMRKGSFSYFDNKMAQGFDLHVNAVIEGSLRPGTRQAVVVLACDFPIGGTAAAYLFDERPTGTVRLGKIADADWGGDWGAGPQSIKVRFLNGVLYVDQCQYTNDCKKRKETTYALRGMKLVQLSTSLHADPATAAIDRRNDFSLRGSRYADKKDYAHAIATYTEALRLYPNDAWFNAARGRAYSASGDYARAIADFNTAIRLFPGDFSVVLDRGWAYAQSAEYRRAIADYTTLLGFGPHDPDVLLDRGNAYDALHDAKSALADYTEAIRLYAAQSASYRAHLGAFESKAQAARDTARQYNAGWIAALLNRAAIRLVGNDYDGGIADLTSAIALDPRNATARRERCHARVLNDDALPGAVGDCELALQVRPTDVSSREFLALAYFRMGNFARTIAESNAALKQSPRLSGALYLRGVAKRNLGDRAGGEADIAAAKRLRPGIDTLMGTYDVR